MLIYYGVMVVGAFKAFCEPSRELSVAYGSHFINLEYH